MESPGSVDKVPEDTKEAEKHNLESSNETDKQADPKKTKETTMPQFFPSMEAVDMKRNQEGNAYYIIAPMRRITLKKWQNTVLIDVREVRTLSPIRSTTALIVFLRLMSEQNLTGII